jgi:ribosome-binding ATPase YchF (GTP1/OBG family)
MDLYSDNCDTEAVALRYEELFSKVNKIDKQLNKARKKQKDGKKGGNKKFKKRLKVLELEHEQLKYFLKSFAMYQNTKPEQKPAWWQNALTNSLPKLLDLASVVCQNRSQRTPLYLPDKLDQK